MRDGIRLATLHIWPIDVADSAPAILVRTPYGVNAAGGAMRLAGRLLAECGYHVVLQDVRGRYRSEGRFTPFVNERCDGGDTLEWISKQPWCDGRIGLFGASYLGYAAWAALAEAPQHVGAMSIAIGSGDIYPLFYSGGAFTLRNALEWGVGVGERENVPRRRIDLERGLMHRPIYEADRVALRVVDWFRDWLDHPRRDEFWSAIRTPLPETVPPTLLIGGWYDLFLSAQLADYDALVRASQQTGAEHPRLLIGPWAHGLPARLRWWRWEMSGTILRETIRYFDEYLRGAPERSSHPRVRYFSSGTDRWCDETSWPPAAARPRRLHLRGAAEGRRLCWNAPESDEDPDRYSHDVAQPVPTRGGALLGLKGGVRDQRALDDRLDVLVYYSWVLEDDLEIAGEVRLVLYAASSSADVDYTAKLTDSAPDGRSLNLCDGIVRCPSREKHERADEATCLGINLGAAATVLRAGHRIRLEVSSSNFPRFDRNPGSPDASAHATPGEDQASQQTVFHDAARASHLLLPVVSG